MKFDNYIIRPLTNEDAERFFHLIDRNRKRLETFFSGTVARTMTLEDSENYVSEIVKKAQDKTYLQFLLIDTSNQNIAGFLDAKNIDWNIPKAELGCFMDEKYSGKNLSGKAFLLFIDFLLNNLGFNKLFLRTHKDNIAARKLAEKCGFEIEGTLRKDYKTSNGELVDLLYYGMLKNP